MPALTKFIVLPAAVFLLAAASAQASDTGDIARRYNLSVPIVETVLKNIDSFFASADAPENRMTSGLLKDLALKTVKAHMSRLEEETPGKATENVAEEKNATYKVTVRTTRHEATETAECVEANATASGAEGVPVVKDGAFAFDSVHPKNTSFSWKMSFCRTPTNGGSDFTDWQLR
ncbi:hypothetical protein [Telmatospirillum siberiense]|uniref:Uncharacterized protein n=1 Tax=Telmatospirillum siberiense TaxID=382514 RepID=A0A2N3Q0J7_9PROT|nr:hypothetical protein [Telmatospirillum siberiense]PKU26173.1 hypothetical protein CWS72_03350 [Telmatospirillum siberiense]